MTDIEVASEPSPEIDFWFEFGSTYSYLSVMRIDDEARRRGVRIIWKPFLLGPIFRALGMESSLLCCKRRRVPMCGRTGRGSAEMFRGNDHLDDALLFASDRKA